MRLCGRGDGSQQAHDPHAHTVRQAPHARAYSTDERFVDHDVSHCAGISALDGDGEYDLRHVHDLLGKYINFL